MKLKNLILILSMLLLYLMNFNLIAQEKSTTNINYDSLWTIMNKLCIPVDKMTSPVKPLNEIQNEFITKIDTSNFTNEEHKNFYRSVDNHSKMW